ncbi:hypothetical protein W97_00644 [Coniosporium apollinis CBS 100218]|uniref:Transcriptional regulatory protein RXT2 N-terminal domain-containing protein n=1 Tax=Coniosporium apollinis (strain CBS 100218) TaxID=1168221 RepID=R7YHZ1_CONA1|nr:uncharacterized protein W97_00644 [Coniosporium apollinis CBS 100218]EON61429.1 hypothetical protein W97_00644 [Coniosporium apollinis CBS 100218]
MASQQAYFQDVLFGMKKALARADDASDSDDSVERLTNRGQKRKRNAKYVQEGRLDNSVGPRVYRRQIEHAGYQRHIISHNPQRFDADGDPLEDDEEDSQADADALEENPFGEVKLEELLAPLTSAADLPTHPSLSTPYYSKSLTEMVEGARLTLQREKANLWRMKHLLTRFRGDHTWTPCGIFATDYDQVLLRALMPSNYRAVFAFQNGGPQDQGSLSWDNNSDSRTLGMDGLQTPPTTSALLQAPEAEARPAEDVQMLGGTSVQHFDAAEATIDTVKAIAKKANGEESAAQNGATTDGVTKAIDHSGEADDSASQPPAHRMTTRAQAHANSNPLSPRSSPTRSATADVVPPIHPFFNFLPSCRPDRDVGLPPEVAEDTRKFLNLYVQRQEEVIRGVEQLYDGLLKAERMRKEVIKWAKAEGHVGEMSDGEDWYDKDEWGLLEDLVKGKEEEEVDEVPGKKTRGRTTK